MCIRDRFLHFAGTDFYYDVQATYAERLGAASPGAGAKKVFYTNSGTEAVEACLKASRWASRRPLVLGFLGAFHGRTAGSLAVTASKPVHRARYSAGLVGVVHAPYPNPYRNPWGIDGYDDPSELSSRALDYIESFLFRGPAPPSDVSACIVEPVQGEGGYVVPPPEFLPALQRLLQREGIHLVVDEVQTGFGRTGRLFASEHTGIAPDMMAVAKAIASGVPMGAAVLKAEHDWGVSGAHSNTYGGNPLACAAAIATLDVIEAEGLVARAKKVGAHLEARLDELAQRDDGIGDVRGVGLMLAMDLVTDARAKTHDKKRRDKVVDACFRKGLLLLPCGESAVRFIPPLTVSEAACDRAVEVVAASLKETKPGP